MGEFLGISADVIDNVMLEADTNKDGEISLEEWVNYVMSCKGEDQNGIKRTLLEQLNKEEIMKMATTTLRIKDRINIQDTNMKLNNEEINYAKEIAKNTVDQ